MHAKYVSTSAPILAQVINDLCLLLSGSPISALSASCDKVYSTLISTILPGWTQIDQGLASSGSVVSSPDVSTLTTKFVRIYAPTTASIDIVGYETWNAVAHTGTNATPANAAINCLTYTLNAANTYWVFATSRLMYISSSNGIGLGAFEFTRDCEYLKGTSYPNFVIAGPLALCGDTSGFGKGSGAAALGLSSFAALYIPRMKNLLAAGDQTSASLFAGTVTARAARGYFYMNSNAAYINPPIGSPLSPLLDASGATYHELRPIWVTSSFLNQSSSVSGRQAILGKLYEVIETTVGSSNTFDTFSYGSDTYMAFATLGGTFALKIA